MENIIKGKSVSVTTATCVGLEPMTTVFCRLRVRRLDLLTINPPPFPGVNLTDKVTLREIFKCVLKESRTFYSRTQVHSYKKKMLIIFNLINGII